MKKQTLIALLLLAALVLTGCGKTPDVAQLEKDIEALQNQVDALSARLDALEEKVRENLFKLQSGPKAKMAARAAEKPVSISADDFSDED